MDVVYAIVHGCYSDWNLDGFFTTEEEAEKYVVANSYDSDYSDPYIMEMTCMDGEQDLSGVVVKYESTVWFGRNDEGSWDCQLQDSPTLYQAQYLRSNSITVDQRAPTGTLPRWINVYVNTTRNDKEIVKKIAQDIFYQFLNECDGKPTKEAVSEFNKILSAEEDSRNAAETEKKLRLEELSELKRLKDKYEN